MARLTTVEVSAVSGETAAIFKEIEGAFGMVPNLFKSYAHHPPLLKANWNKVKAVMMEGTLSQKVKQTIAVLVSRDNGCTYCVAAHTGALKAIGISDEEIGIIMQSIEQADFSAKEKALIGFARKANTNPTRIEDAEFDALRQAGVSDAEIVEALGVMELFTAFNKFLDSLQVEIDF
ncbi:putative peroxidase-related enzyme [Geobacter metallireducens RCH3]|uniref:Carboxymuconolactone decarboxylase family protein n=1 Tax=Geobacter metallireducens (strain ATCC 53774 / DSM 7210 / GS-15) TaxID=269799 RepID=Q39SB0_GEOMG|nr:peroxidase-related enzyme [Geobacter metallireducens]ABB32864.1 carboxymuconolactone decarboxylase family protein [Geobacter metallireducens GS-15]EHP89003.1 putative peroxidase-related enzyme [Geobacter metallireducens RCH3]